jgi:hypothetical protein
MAAVNAGVLLGMVVWFVLGCCGSYYGARYLRKTYPEGTLKRQNIGLITFGSLLGPIQLLAAWQALKVPLQGKVKFEEKNR